MWRYDNNSGFPLRPSFKKEEEEEEDKKQARYGQARYGQSIHGQARSLYAASVLLGGFYFCHHQELRKEELEEEEEIQTHSLFRTLAVILVSDFWRERERERENQLDDSDSASLSAAITVGGESRFADVLQRARKDYLLYRLTSPSYF